jgi:hypothetical protein
MANVNIHRIMDVKAGKFSELQGAYSDRTSWCQHLYLTCRQPGQGETTLEEVVLFSDKAGQRVLTETDALTEAKVAVLNKFAKSLSTATLPYSTGWRVIVRQVKTLAKNMTEDEARLLQGYLDGIQEDVESGQPEQALINSVKFAISVFDAGSLEAVMAHAHNLSHCLGWVECMDSYDINR